MPCNCKAPAPGDAWDTLPEVNPKCPDHGPVMDMTTDEYEAIREEIWSAPWNDPALFPACMEIGVAALGEIAVSCLTLEDAERVARNVLRQMVYRAKVGEMQHIVESQLWV